MTSTTLRHDFYQTDGVVNLSIFVKGLKQEDVKVEFQPQSLKVTIQKDTETVFSIDPLFSSIDPVNSSFKILSTKIDVALQKTNFGLRWPLLQGAEAALVSDSTPKYQTASSSTSTSTPTQISSSDPSASIPAFQTRKQNKWDSFKVEEDPQDPSNVDGFFQTLFKGADQDTQKAMMKSYQESGGTALSTNWGEVQNKKYEVDPPDGMEARKYER